MQVMTCTAQWGDLGDELFGRRRTRTLLTLVSRHLDPGANPPTTVPATVPSELATPLPGTLLLTLAWSTWRGVCVGEGRTGLPTNTLQLPSPSSFWTEVTAAALPALLHLTGLDGRALTAPDMLSSPGASASQGRICAWLFPLLPVSAHSSRHVLYRRPSVSMGGWFQDPPQVPESSEVASPLYETTQYLHITYMHSSRIL